MCTRGGTFTKPPWTAEYPKIDWRVRCVIDFYVIDSVLLTRGRHYIGGAPENLEVH
jgi:hypothetical protein